MSICFSYVSYRGAISSTRVVIADLVVRDHRDIFQELELYRNLSYIHCFFSLEKHLHFLKYILGEIKGKCV